MPQKKLSGFATWVGFDDLIVTPDYASAKVRIQRECCRDGYAAPGILAAAADALASELVAANVGPLFRTTKSDSNANFIASIPEGNMVSLVCEIVHRDERRVVWEARVSGSDGRLAAVVSGTELAAG